MDDAENKAVRRERAELRIVAVPGLGPVLHQEAQGAQAVVQLAVEAQQFGVAQCQRVVQRDVTFQS